MVVDCETLTFLTLVSLASLEERRAGGRGEVIARFCRGGAKEKRKKKKEKKEREREREREQKKKRKRIHLSFY